ncbi:hypothetical protein AB6A40_003332, partial [Gnathostoma spinigerum]
MSQMSVTIHFLLILSATIVIECSLFRPPESPYPSPENAVGRTNRLFPAQREFQLPDVLTAIRYAIRLRVFFPYPGIKLPEGQFQNATKHIK